MKSPRPRTIADAAAKARSALRGPVARGAAAMAALRAYALAVGFLTFAVLGRSIGAEGLGAFALGGAAASALSLFARLGVDQSAMRDIANAYALSDRRRARLAARFLFSSIIIQTVLISGLSAAIIHLASPFPAADLHRAALIGVATVPAMSITFAATGLLRAFLKTPTAAFVELFIPTTIQFILVVAVIRYGEIDASSALLAALAAWISAGAAAVVLAARFWRAAWRGAPVDAASAAAGGDRLNLRRSAFAFFAASILGALIGRIEAVALASILDADELGRYAAAFRLAQVCALPGVAIAGGLAPRIAALHAGADQARMQAIIATAARVGVLATALASIVVLAAAPATLRFISPDLAAAAPIVGVFVAAFTVQSLFGRGFEALTMSAHAADAAALAPISAVLYVCLLTLLGHIAGAQGAAAALLIVLFLHSAIASIVAYRRTGLRCDVFPLFRSRDAHA